MASGKKTGGKDFQPGQSGNPKGRPPLPDDLKRARALLKEDFERCAHQLLQMTHQQLDELLKDKTSNLLQLMVAGIMGKAISQGDQVRLNFLLDRIIGPLPKSVELSAPGGERLFPEFSDDDLTEALLVVRKIKGGNKCSLPQNQQQPSASRRRSSRRALPTDS